MISGVSLCDFVCSGVFDFVLCIQGCLTVYSGVFDFVCSGVFDFVLCIQGCLCVQGCLTLYCVFRGV